MKANYILKIWILFSGLYLTKIMPISPVYVVFLIGLICFVFYYAVNNNKNIHIFSVIIFFSSLMCLFQFSLTTPALTLNFILTFLSPILVFGLFRNTVFSIRFFNIYVLFYFLVFLVDGIWRLYHPNLEFDQAKLDAMGIGFHIYKFNSLMYIDSNFVGLQAVFVFSIFLWANSFYNQRLNKFILLLAFTSILLTISRAAYIGVLIAIIIYYVQDSKKRIYFTSFLSVITLAFVGNIAIFMKQDASFESKFMIIDRMFTYLETADILSLIFGVGVGNAKNVLDVGAHNLFVSLIVETGVLGMILFLTYLLYFFLKISYGRTLLILPFMVVSMSLSTLAIPYFFSFLALAMLVVKKSKKDKKTNLCLLRLSSSES